MKAIFVSYRNDETQNFFFQCNITISSVALQRKPTCPASDLRLTNCHNMFLLICTFSYFICHVVIVEIMRQVDKNRISVFKHYLRNLEK